MQARTSPNHFKGIRQCLSYSLPPNSLSYCGPRRNEDLYFYQSDPDKANYLRNTLSEFNTLYTYLAFIAYQNNLKDPFDHRVVQAYWIGSNLLEKTDLREFHKVLKDKLEIKNRLSKTQITQLFGKLPRGLLPNHAFHVLNVPWRTGYLPIEHTLETMDKCRISWGRIKEIHPDHLMVNACPLKLSGYRLKLGNCKEVKIQRGINGQAVTKNNLAKGELITFHWEVFVEKADKALIKNLRHYTLLAIRLANEDIRTRQQLS